MRGRRHAERLALDRATARHRAFGRVCQGGAALPSSKDVGQYFGGLRFSAVFRERVGEGAYSIKRIARPVALELATDIESPHAKRRIFSPTLLRIIIESEKLEGIGMGNTFFAMISQRKSTRLNSSH